MKVNGVAGTGAKKDWRIRAVAVTTPYSSTEGFFIFHNKRRFHLFRLEMCDPSLVVNCLTEKLEIFAWFTFLGL